MADSIDVLMPNQRLREMHAVRSAVAEGAADTTKFRTPENDRLMGDTIIAYFDTTAAPVNDTTSQPKIQRLVSLGSASSLQHLPPRDTTLRTPALVYVTGTAITVSFDSGAVQRVRVHNQDLASGIYLEPGPDSTRAGSPAPAGAAPATGGTAPAPAASPGTTPATTPAATPAVPLPGSPVGGAAPPTVPPRPAPSGASASPTAVPPRRP